MASRHEITARGREIVAELQKLSTKMRGAAWKSADSTGIYRDLTMARNMLKAARMKLESNDET